MTSAEIAALEEETMGSESKDSDSSKSSMIGRNLYQMIDVLKHRLDLIKEAAIQRKEYCAYDEDPKEFTRCSDDLPKKIATDLDEMTGTKGGNSKEVNL